MTSASTGASGVVRRALPFLAAALVCVIAGGMLAAATAYVTTQKTAWATAYLVLVGGIAQAGLGAALSGLAQRPSARLAWVVFVLFNAGNAAVLTGQLAGFVAVTLTGGAMLVAALVVVIVATRRGVPAHPGLVWGFRVLVVVLAVSIPTGLVLALFAR